MDWQPLSKAEHRKAEAAAAHLESLGVPSSVLNDLLPEDIAACKGAQQAATDVKEYPVNGAILRLTTVLVQLPGEGESYRAFHHFEWDGSPGFCGTECLELLPIYDFSGLGFSSPPGSTVTGRVLYDKNGQTFASPYCKLGERFRGQPRFSAAVAVPLGYLCRLLVSKRRECPPRLSFLFL